MGADALFASVDWNATDVGALTHDLEDELAAIEEENIRALLDSASRAAAVLPALSRAEHETSAVERMLAEYSERLAGMGAEISQIEEVNRGLAVQQANQQRLLAELDAQLARVELPEATGGVLRASAAELIASMALRDASAAAIAQRQVAALLADVPQGSLRGVAERADHWGREAGALLDAFDAAVANVLGTEDVATLVALDASALPARLACMDAADAFLEAHAPFFGALRDTAPRRYAVATGAYSRGATARLAAELGAVVRGPLLGVRAVRRTADERAFLFTALSGSLTALGERIYSFGAVRTTRTSFGMHAVPLLPGSGSLRDSMRGAVLEDAGAGLGADQAMDYALLLVAPVAAHAQQAVARGLCGAGVSGGDLERVDALLSAALSPALADVLAGTLVDGLAGRGDGLAAYEALLALDRRLPEAAAVPVLSAALGGVRARLLLAAERHVAEQCAAIDAMRYSARRREGVLPYVAQFPQYFLGLEALYAERCRPSLLGDARSKDQIGNGAGASPGSAEDDSSKDAKVESRDEEPRPSVRELVDGDYARVVQSIFRSLDGLAADADGEKERINAAVMLIQNAQHLVSALEGVRGAQAVVPVLALARARYAANVASYARMSLHRVFSAPVDALAAMAAAIAAGSVPADDIPLRPEYARARMRSLLGALDADALRTGVRVAFKRVEKHFARDRALQRAVWRAMRTGWAQDTASWAAVLARVYRREGDVRLSFGPADSDAAFAEFAALLGS